MALHFDAVAVQRLLDHSLSSPGWVAPTARISKDSVLACDDESLPAGRPGLYLVGDDGVYLVSNGLPGLKVEKDHSHIVYSDESNSLLMTPERWVSAKLASWGGSDGVKFLSANNVQAWLASAQNGKVAVTNPEKLLAESILRKFAGKCAMSGKVARDLECHHFVPVKDDIRMAGRTYSKAMSPGSSILLRFVEGTISADSVMALLDGPDITCKDRQAAWRRMKRYLQALPASEWEEAAAS